MLVQGVLTALNHLLHGAPWACTRLAPFAGQAVRVILPPFSVDFVVCTDGLLEAIAPAQVTKFAVEISLPAEAPLLALQNLEALRKAIRLTGSADFAEALSFVLRNLRWDFEEDLSHYLGDIAAHRVATGVRSLAVWHQQALRNLAENFVEYLAIEQRPQPSLVRPVEATAFGVSVGQLQEQTALLEQRIRRLAQPSIKART